jgi:AAA15 family ATPase/GTPase
LYVAATKKENKMNHLVNFKVKNFRSFYDEAILSMQASPNKEMAELNTFRVNENLLPKGENELIKSAVIFGANASGKSNLIKALIYMRNVVLVSADQRYFVPYANEPFAYYTFANSEPTEFEIDFIANDIFYNYGFTITDKKITKEFLNKRIDRRLSNVFERDGTSIITLANHGEVAKFIDVKEQTLFLSFSTNLKLPVVDEFRKIVKWFGDLIINTEMMMNVFDIYAEDKKYLDAAAEILKQADFGIDNFEVVKNKLADLNNPFIPIDININSKMPPQIKQEKTEVFSVDIATSFNIYDDKDRKAGERKVGLLKDYGFNSNGTYRLMSFLGLMIKNLHKGGVIVVDEIDSQLHFLVADYLLRMYNSISMNPNRSQLICTAHSVQLMDEDLRRDQIYFTIKDEKGKTTLHALSDFNGVKKSDLYSKKYLAGFYSAIPNIRSGM